VFFVPFVVSILDTHWAAARFNLRGQKNAAGPIGDGAAASAILAISTES
jgi:hypothetical protein